MGQLHQGDTFVEFFTTLTPRHFAQILCFTWEVVSKLLFPPFGQGTSWTIEMSFRRGCSEVNFPLQKKIWKWWTTDLASNSLNISFFALWTKVNKHYEERVWSGSSILLPLHNTVPENTSQKCTLTRHVVIWRRCRLLDKRFRLHHGPFRDENMI